MEKKDPLALHEPNAEARARGYLRGAVVRWSVFDGAELGIVIGHDVEGDPMVVFPTEAHRCADAISMEPTKARLTLLRPAPAPAPVDPELARLLRHDCPDPDGPETPIEGARRLVETLRAARAQHERIAEALGASPASDIEAFARGQSRAYDAVKATEARLRSEVERERASAESAEKRHRAEQGEIAKALGFDTFYGIPGVLARIARLVDLERKAPAPAPAPAPASPDLHRAFVAGAIWGLDNPEAAEALRDGILAARIET